jgi:hypothetical protein
MSSVVQKLSKAMESDEGSASNQRNREDLNAFEFAAINEAQGEEDDIILVSNQVKKGKSASDKKAARKSMSGSRTAAEQFQFENTANQGMKDTISDGGTPPKTQNVGIKQEMAATPGYNDKHQYMDDDDDLIGTSPINLPDPSIFSD